MEKVLKQYGQDLYLSKNSDSSYEMIKGLGGEAGASVGAYNARYQVSAKSGEIGKNYNSGGGGGRNG